MRIEMIKNVKHALKKYQKGETYHVTEDLAHDWIEAGYASLRGEETQKTPEIKKSKRGIIADG